MTDFSSSETWKRDPKHLGFTFARYKFVAKMLVGKQRVMEIGCGDGIATDIVRQTVGDVFGFDSNASALPVYSVEKKFFVHDILSGPWPAGDSETFDAAYALDVLEHIAGEDTFMENVCASLKEHGTLIIGMPSLESQQYASPESKAEHVNCKTEEGLRELLNKYFHCSYIFGMNDETLHVGHGSMCHYRLGVATCKK